MAQLERDDWGAATRRAPPAPGGGRRRVAFLPMDGDEEPLELMRVPQRGELARPARRPAVPLMAPVPTLAADIVVQNNTLNIGSDAANDLSLYAARTMNVAEEQSRRNMGPCPICAAQFGKPISRADQKGLAKLYDLYLSTMATMSQEMQAVLVCETYEKEIREAHMRTQGQNLPRWEPAQFIRHCNESHIICARQAQANKIRDLTTDIALARATMFRVDDKQDFRPDNKTMSNYVELNRALRQWFDWNPRGATLTAEGLR